MHEHQPPAAQLRGEVEQPPREARAAGVGPPPAGQRVAAVDVEARGNQDDVRAHLARHGREQLPVHGQEVGVAGSGGQRHVDRGPLTCAEPHLLERPCAGIERPLVGAEIDHRGIVLKGGLSPVTVVDVPVDDQHPAKAEIGLGVARRNRDVVEEAESPGAVALRVVAGRPHKGKGVPDLARATAAIAAQHPPAAQRAAR